MVLYLAACITLISYVISLGNWVLSSTVYLSTLALIVYTQRQYTAVVHMALGFFSIKLIEVIAFQFIPLSINSNLPSVWVNNNIYFTHLLIDFIFLAFIVFRPPISRTYLRKLRFVPTRAKDLTYTRAEIVLLTVTCIYIVVDLLAVIENLIRNMEHLGINSSFAESFWHWEVVFDFYPTIKQCLNTLEFLLIWSTINRLARANPKFLA